MWGRKKTISFYIEIVFSGEKEEERKERRLGVTYPLRTPRIRFMTKNAPRTTIDTKYINCHLFPMAS